MMTSKYIYPQFSAALKIYVSNTLFDLLVCIFDRPLKFNKP